MSTQEQFNIVVPISGQVWELAPDEIWRHAREAAERAATQKGMRVTSLDFNGIGLMAEEWPATYAQFILDEPGLECASFVGTAESQES